ncbi:hypothetical protein [Pandoraea horticolens]|uniref:hypothetical protein n=1 Tax=Pandoraea horticolens TaxID=2508298 RepID=UPI001242732D|nr:hypothetical protein [Pandoraea horticolens]
MLPVSGAQAPRLQPSVAASTSAPPRQSAQPPTTLTASVRAVYQAGESSGMPSNWPELPSPPATPSILDAVLDMQGVPASHADAFSRVPSTSAQRSPHPETQEPHVNGCHRERVAPQDAGSGEVLI